MAPRRRHISLLSTATINNMRSEMYGMEERARIYPNDPYREKWLERAAELRLRLGVEAIPLSYRNSSHAQGSEAQSALDEMEKLTHEKEQ